MNLFHRFVIWVQKLKIGHDQPASVVQRANNALHRISHHAVDRHSLFCHDLTACLLHHDMVWKYFILFSPRTLHAINVLALGELNLSSTRFIVIQQRTSSLKSM